MKNSLFELTADHKQILKDISSLCGVKEDTVTMVWKYTVLMNFVRQLEKKGGPFEFQIPLVGKILCKKVDGEDWEVWPILSESLKDSMTKLKLGDSTSVTKWIESELIEPVVREIEEQ